AGLEKRRRIGRPRGPFAGHELHHGVGAVAAAARDVDIIGAALLQRQADELAASLDFRPVVKLVAHGGSPVGTAVELTALRRTVKTTCCDDGGCLTLWRRRIPRRSRSRSAI